MKQIIKDIMKEKPIGITIGKELVLIIALMFLSACTQDKDVKFADGDGENLLQIAMLKEAVISMETSDQLGSKIAFSRKGNVTIRKGSYQGPQQLKAMFNGLVLKSDSNQAHTVVFKVNAEYLTAYKKMDKKELSDFEKNQAVMEGDTALVPLFMYKIDAFGTAVRRKNDLGEETSTLRLAPTPWDAATVVSISTRSSDRREIALSEAEKENLFSIGSLQKLTAKVSIGEVKSLTPNNALRLVGQKKMASNLILEEANGFPEEILSQLQIPVTDEEIKKGVRLHLATTTSQLTVSKVVKEESLSIFEQQLLKQSQTLTNASSKYIDAIEKTVAIPLVVYSVSDAGIIRQKTNTNGISQPDLELSTKDITPEKVTHVKIDLSRENRNMVSASLDGRQDKEIFIDQLIDQKIFNALELKDQLNIKMNITAPVVYSEVLDSEIQLFKITTQATLSDRAQKMLKEGHPSVKKCSKNLISQLTEKTLTELSTAMGVTISSEPAQRQALERCVVVLDKSIDFTRVAAERVLLDAENLSHQIVYRHTSEITNLIQIEELTVVADQNPTDESHYIDPVFSLTTKDIRNKKFLFRVTLQDAPNEFKYAFAGSASSLEIIKFELNDQHIKVIKNKALNSSSGANSLDREVLMSIPVSRYVRKEVVAEDGSKLPAPIYKTTTKDDPAAIAVVQWDADELGNSHSPMKRLSPCFEGRSGKSVSAVDNRLDATGVLNFSISADYKAKDFCSGLYAAGYFDRVQSNYTFKERISFKEYVETNNSVINMPYSSQKMLGFGLFTYEKNSEDLNTSPGRSGSKVYLPALFDIPKGQKITYVLAGLPEDNSLQRAAIIQATKEVVADWNKAFVKAALGTKLQRRGDFIELAIEGGRDGEGVSIEKGQLGDLDKNYLYVVQKASKSSVIGLGGSHPNPETGLVENGSVYIYTGNIQSYVRSLKRTAKARKEYRSIMDQVLRADVKVDQGSSKDTSASSASVNRVNSTEAISQLRFSQESDLDHQSKMIKDLFKDISQKTTVVDSAVVTRDMVDLGAVNLQRALKNFYHGKQSVPLSADEAAQRMSGPALALYEAYQEAVENNSLDNAQAFESLFNKHTLKRDGSRLTVQQRQRLQATVQGETVKQKLLHQRNDIHECIYDTAEAGVSIGVLGNEDEMSDLELLVRIYKPTLAHEIGHNLGLRHNFIATYDKANWKFEGETEEMSQRNYSSVMDYQVDDHMTYDGLGPQDVASIRAAYAGVVELHPQILSQVQSNEQGGQSIASAAGVEVEVVGGRFVKLSDFPTAVGASSWDALAYNQLGALPLKVYKFCSDEDAGYYPTCNRFDKGTTPEEIVDHIVANYKEMYSLTNFIGDRLNFSYLDSGSYTGRLFSNFIRIRQFLEETIYQAITGGSEVGPMSQAAFKGLLFFNSLIKTPDASNATTGLGRFDVVDSEEGQFFVEKKWLKDISFGDGSDKISVRGIEFDKVIAMMMLTQRRMGFQRYEQASLRFSYPEFERLVFRGTPDLQLPTVRLIHDVLKDHIQPTTTSPLTGQTVSLAGKFASETSELLRIYAVIGGISSLDVEGIEASSNVSALFRVFSSFDQIPGIESVVQPGAEIENPTTLKYFAGADSLVAQSVLSTNVGIASLESKRAELEPLINKWIALQLAEERAPAAAESAKKVDQVEEDVAEEVGKEGDEDTQLTDLEQTQQQINSILTTLSDQVQVLDFEVLGGFILNTIEVSNQLADIQAQVSAKQFTLILEEQTNNVANLSKQFPILGASIAMIDFTKLTHPELAEQVLAPGTSERQKGLIFSNLETINRFFYSIHSEFNR